ncbi:ISAzo13-like element transposase-related protein, partial [Thiolapillus sp.]|uniref:ISAzo13-like element transposase-related protein n=3 Tax=Thiolapillus sp. TaxID=2017437 RepID=UPI003AF8B03E
MLLPKQAKSYLWFAQGKVTADFMVDRLEELWKTFAPEDRPHTLVINADNGPENSSRRTQWMKRLTEFSDTHQIRIRLAYYPPYHSKYNPVERLWGVLENHWRGELLDSQVCLRPRDRFWDIPVPKIDSAFDNLFVPQPSWSPNTTQQLRKLVAAPYLAPNDWTPRSEAYFVFPLAQGTPGKQ